MITLGSLFSGIGGAELASTLAGGYEHAWAVELAEHPAEVLRRRFPGLRIERDATDHTMKLPRVDVLTAGFPCQPFSVAGQRKGANDERNLWPDTARWICDVRPRVVLLENVPALRNPHGGGSAYLGTVLGDLAALGYVGSYDCIPASFVGAPHRRDRIWIVAFAVEPFDPFEAFRQGRASIGPWWQTPTVGDATGGHSNRGDLRTSVHTALSPTAQSRDHKGATALFYRERGGGAKGEALPPAVAQALCERGVLNPEWVDMLMGYPRGWTDLDNAGELPAGPPPWHGEGVLRVGDVPGTNPKYADYWYGLPDVVPLRKRDKQTTPRLMALGNAWVPQVAVPILRTIREGLG